MAQPTGAFPIQGDEEAGAGPFPYQIAPPSAVRSRRLYLFALTGLAAYLIALAATLPARLLLDRAGTPEIWLAAAGTVWNGEAALAEGHAVRWRWAPLASLANLAFTTDLEIDGPDTKLGGAAAWRPSGLVVTNLRGDASASLLGALAPDLPLLCDFAMRVEIDRIALGGQQPGISGEVRSSPGACAPRSSAAAASVPVPALLATGSINVAGSSGWVAPVANRRQRLVTFNVMPNGATSIEVSPAGAMLFPGTAATRVVY